MGSDVALGLEQFLQQLMGEGHLDSTGRFSMEAQKALDKTAAFQLPSPAAWILKVVQAAVAGGCRSIQIRQRESETEVVFQTVAAWDLKCFEGCFFSIDSESDRSLDHLKRGLWSCGYHGRRPFRIAVQGCPQSLVWTGKEFLEQILPRSENTSLVVAHRAFDANTSRLETGSDMNKAIEHELRTSAYTCPVPLLLGDVRLDSLQGCLTHGLGDQHYPLRASWTAIEGLSMPIPPATLGGYRTRTCEYAKLANLFGIAPDSDPNPAAAILISMHLKKTVGSVKIDTREAEQYEVLWIPLPSVLYWVLDGVVAGSRELGEKTGISAAVFCSAEGLKTDATGLRVVKDELSQRRCFDACERFHDTVNDLSADLSVLDENNKQIQRKRIFGGICMVGSMLLCPFNLLWGLGGIIVGVALTFRAPGQELSQLASDLPKKTAEFSQAWKSLLAQIQSKSAL